MDEPNPYRSPSGGAPAVPPLPSPEPGANLDFGRTFSFFFQDPDWIKKLLLGSLFTLLGFLIVGMFFVAGYMIRLIRRSAAGEVYPLPDWDDLGGIFMDGLVAVGAYLGYILPLILLYAIPAVGIAIVAGGDREAGVIMALFGMVAFVVFALIVLAAVAFLPAAFTRLALRGNLGAAFEFEEIFAYIKRNVGNYVLAFLVILLANAISQFGILLLCIGIFPASFWGTAVGAYALGEVARRDRGPGGLMSVRS